MLKYTYYWASYFCIEMEIELVSSLYPNWRKLFLLVLSVYRNQVSTLNVSPSPLPHQHQHHPPPICQINLTTNSIYL